MTLRFLTLLLYFALITGEFSHPIPVVLWHGMGDCCCNPLSLGYIKDVIQEHIPDIYVLSLKIGDNIVQDVENGFFMNSNKQVSQVCEKLANDSRLKNGYNAVGFSQGAQFLRAVAERCHFPAMRNLISVGGQHQGVYGFPHCPGKEYFCNIVRRLLSYDVYSNFVQNSLVQAQYWHDPLDERAYRHKSIFLADINNELNERYKKNLLQLHNMVLIMFTNDTMVIPKESEWFGWYSPEDVKQLVPMESTTLYTEDRIGLRILNDSGRLHFLAVNGDHLQLSKEFLISEIIGKYLR